MLSQEQYHATITHEAFCNMQHAVVLAGTQKQLNEVSAAANQLVAQRDEAIKQRDDQQATIVKQQATIEAKSADIESFAKYMDMSVEDTIKLCKVPEPAVDPLPVLTEVVDGEGSDQG